MGIDLSKDKEKLNMGIDLSKDKDKLPSENGIFLAKNTKDNLDGGGENNTDNNQDGGGQNNTDNNQDGGHNNTEGTQDDNGDTGNNSDSENNVNPGNVRNEDEDDAGYETDRSNANDEPGMEPMPRTPRNLAEAENLYSYIEDKKMESSGEVDGNDKLKAARAYEKLPQDRTDRDNKAIRYQEKSGSADSNKTDRDNAIRMRAEGNIEEHMGRTARINGNNAIDKLVNSGYYYPGNYIVKDDTSLPNSPREENTDTSREQLPTAGTGVSNTQSTSNTVLEERSESPKANAVETNEGAEPVQNSEAAEGSQEPDAVEAYQGPEEDLYSASPRRVNNEEAAEGSQEPDAVEAYQGPEEDLYSASPRRVNNEEAAEGSQEANAVETNERAESEQNNEAAEGSERVVETSTENKSSNKRARDSDELSDDAKDVKRRRG